MSFYRSIMYPVAARIDAESTHNMALRSLSLISGNARLQSTLRHSMAVEDPRLRTTVAGLDFANPVGLSAGFDKTGRVVNAFGAIGAGFAEIGTVTPLGQLGRPRPRIF